MGVQYGYYLAPNGHVAINQEKANIVRMIYQQYLSGMSLGRIADFLFKRDIPSPKDRDRWTQPVLSNLLSNQKYIGYIVSFDDFFLAQGEKSRRSNIDEDTHQRKATRYNSQSVLSGLLVCAECGHNYRRITRHLARSSGVVPVEWSMGKGSVSIRLPYRRTGSRVFSVRS